MKAVMYQGEVMNYLGSDIASLEQEKVEKVINYVREYKRILASGVSYNNLVELSKYDIQLYLDITTKMNMLDIEYEIEGKIDDEYIDKYHDAVVCCKYDQTATNSIDDARCRALALRLLKRK